MIRRPSVHPGSPSSHAPLTNPLDALRPLTLAGILLLTAVLNLFRLDQVGQHGLGNAYYAAAVQSMLTGPRLAFFLAFDPAGFLAVDKAPLGLWLQALSARLFGFNGLGLLLPQALAGILAVWVLYRIVRRAYGEWPAQLAALTLAVMPISVVTARNNTPDALLILALLLAAWALLRAVDQGARRWLLISAALVGVAFNLKMLQLLLVAPALALLFLAAYPGPWRKRLRAGALALGVGLAVALPWVAVVALTPADQRPYIGGTLTNNIFELIFDYNGIARLWGEDWQALIGPPGPLRLLDSHLAGQSGWLLVFALCGSIAAWGRLRRGAGAIEHSARQRHSLILWTGWLAVGLVYFSISSFFHRYYLATLAPAIAALTGIGASALWDLWRAGGRARIWPLLVLGAAGVLQSVILLPYPTWSAWLIPLIGGLIVAGLGGLILAGWGGRAEFERRAVISYGLGLLALLIAPAVWATIPVLTCAQAVLPIAGPQTIPCPKDNSGPFLDRELLDYLETNRQDARYQAATYDLGISEMGILATGQPWLTLGGFRGTDPILTVDQFAALVAAGEVRFFATLQAEEGGYPGIQGPIRAWVATHCPLSPVQMEGVEVRGPCEAPSHG